MRLRVLAVSISLLSLGFLSGTQEAAADVVAQAAVGYPFGVGRITLRLPEGVDSEMVDTHFFSVTERNGRIFYPALRLTQPLGIFRELVGIPVDGDAQQLHVHFLFTGSEPLEITLDSPYRRIVTVVPSPRPVAHRRLLRAWWVRYKAAARKQRQEAAYTPLVETYLTTMLARRLGLELPPGTRNSAGSGESLEMLLGTEKLRMQMLRDTLLGAYRPDEPNNQPVPPPIAWSEVTHEQHDGVNIEPIARHVPHECYYIRFAQFPNYLWLRKLLEEYGGDLSRMVMLRGTDPQLNLRTEQQLGLRESSLARILGPQVISDVAMIGRDTYLREGAAIGILFEAKSEVLQRDLQGQRQQRVREMASAGATMTTVKIEGQDVTFASTPDHRLRSFYVRDGNYHLVTNCREIARRFLQCGRGIDSLGDSAEFRYARSLNPLAEDNTIFAYLSRAFFEGLLSPQYQIELSRRLQSVTHIELLRLAELAANAEGFGEPTTEQLVELGFLARPVDRLHDGSQLRKQRDIIVDSRRGARGTYLPIPDIDLGRVTQSEVEQFGDVVDFHDRVWPRMDPVLVGLRRTALNEDVERVQVEARMLPINQEKYGVLLGMFGPPTRTQVVPPEDDIVSIQAFIDGGDLSVPAHHLFFGIRDAAPRGDISERRLLKSLQVLRTAPAYVGAWPKPWLLERFGFHGQPTEDGFRRMLLGIYRLDSPRGFSLLGFDRQILAEVEPLLDLEEVAEPAQLRVQIGDVKSSRFGQWANDLDFQRAWETSVGNVQLLHLLTQQFKLPIQDAMTAAQQLLDATLVCPLGGDYQLVQDGPWERWASSVWVDGKEDARATYVSPLMNWLRGLSATATVESDRVVASGYLDIQRPKVEEEGGIKLPLFNFFGSNSSRSDEPESGKAEDNTPVPEELPPPKPVPQLQ